ncbi:hypothetical protein ACTI_63280 [Actinoplanes sp. OR16]|nr:hypothetical protein [Actinoplanes sp. OR16]BBH69643.1 hypothetical protein ACTI_63280 [Actinoplanes sp. OR16]
MNMLDDILFALSAINTLISLAQKAKALGLAEKATAFWRRRKDKVG